MNAPLVPRPKKNRDQKRIPFLLFPAGHFVKQIRSDRNQNGVCNCINVLSGFGLEGDRTLCKLVI
jgi:hypothetical protein